jgi:hypothetical protein
MRQWASPSYDPMNGRAAASSEASHSGSYGFDGEPCHASNQVSEANAGGQGGAPGVSGMNRKQGPRSHREKWTERP